MDAPTIIAGTDADELFAIAGEVERYRVAKKLSISALMRKFAGLGSERTWNKILRRDLKELDPETWLEKYRAVKNLMDLSSDRAETKEALYADLSPALNLESAFIDVMNEPGDARFILMLADTGMGKSCSRRLLIEHYGDRIAWIEATDVWSDSPMALLGEMLLTMGSTNPPYNQVVRLRKVIEKLNERRVCFVVDEGHHLGPRSLNTIKTLINQTPGEFVVLAMKTLWRRLEKEAYEEARQLTGNRLSARIDVSLHEEDVAKMLRRRVTWAEDVDVRAAAKLLFLRAAGKGNLAFVREVCKAINDMSAQTPATMEIFSVALTTKGDAR